MGKADRIPKKIAGLKLPKSIRETPEIRSLLATPRGRKILSDALVEAASIAALRLVQAQRAEETGAAGAGKPRRKSRNGAVPAGAAPVDDVPAEAPQTVLLLDPEVEELQDRPPGEPGPAA